MKIVPKLLLTAGLAIGFTTINVKSVLAAIVNYSFTVDSPTSKGKGLFSFDDSTFSNDSIPETTVQSLYFQFDGESTIYTEKDDINYPDFPVVFSTTYLTGKPSVGLSYSFFDKTNLSDSRFYEIVGEDFTILSATSPNTEIAAGTVSYTKVPEPPISTAALLVYGLGWIVTRKTTSLRKVKI